MMRKLLFLYVCCLLAARTYAQDNSFTLIGKFQNDIALAKLADSLKRPLLLFNTKIYAIGGDCITRDLGGNATGRDDDGDGNEREKDGGANSREKGGKIGYRDKKGNAKNRDKDGNLLDRDKAGSANQRDMDGRVGIGTRCGVTKGGKLVLYTREDISAKQTKIYYQGKYFTSKYYKIIQL